MRKIGCKGAIPLLLIGAIVTMTAFVSVLVPIVYLKIHVDRVVNIQYKYSTADLGTLALISDPKIYEKISLYASGADDHYNFDRTSFTVVLKEKLDKIVESQCYELYFDDSLVVKSEKACNPQFTSDAFILTPYEQDPAVKITLKIE
jgi:hypothetical protein